MTRKIIVELQNGQRFTYINWHWIAIVGDLLALGAKEIGIKNTIHVIPRDVPFPSKRSA